MHFFTQSSSSFRSTCPYHRSLFCCNTNAMSSIPYYNHSLSLISLLGNLSFSLMRYNATHPPDHSQLCSLKCHLIFFPYRPGLTSMQHTASHATTVQPSSHNQWYVGITSLLVSSGTNCLNDSNQFEFSPPQLHQHLHPHLACHLGNKTYPLTPTLHWPQYPH